MLIIFVIIKKIWLIRSNSNQKKLTQMSEKINPITVINSFPNRSRDSLIPMLQEIQDKLGYVSEEAVKEIGRHLNLPTSKIYGLATFYNQFRFTPLGKYHIRVCNGTACHLEKSSAIINELEKILNISDGETTRDGLFSLELLSCIGACGQAPVMAVNEEYYEKLTKESLRELIFHLKEGEEIK